MIVVQSGYDYCGEIGEGEDAAETDLAGCFEGEEGDGEEVEVVWGAGGVSTS